MNFAKFVEDLKNVNPQTPGSWPLPIKIFAYMLMLVGVVAAGAFFDWQDEWNILTGIQEQEIQLKETYMAKKKQAVNLEQIKKQLIETQQAFGALLKQLPTKSEMAALLTDINQAGLGRGLLFELFRPGPEKVNKELAEQPIVIKVSGTYDDLGKFASDISVMPRIVNLGEINIVPNPKGVLVMDAIAKTYRYLDANELTSRKKPAGAR